MKESIILFGGSLHDILIGISLGDAHLRTKTRGNT